MINIKKEFLKTYNFMQIICIKNSENYYCLLRTSVIFSYLKSYNYLQKTDFSIKKLNKSWHVVKTNHQSIPTERKDE